MRLERKREWRKDIRVIGLGTWASGLKRIGIPIGPFLFLPFPISISLGSV